MVIKKFDQFVYLGIDEIFIDSPLRRVARYPSSNYQPFGYADTMLSLLKIFAIFYMVSNQIVPLQDQTTWTT